MVGSLPPSAIDAPRALRSCVRSVGNRVEAQELNVPSLPKSPPLAITLTERSAGLELVCIGSPFHGRPPEATLSACRDGRTEGPRIGRHAGLAPLRTALVRVLWTASGRASPSICPFHERFWTDCECSGTAAMDSAAHCDHVLTVRDGDRCDVHAHAGGTDGGHPDPSHARCHGGAMERCAVDVAAYGSRQASQALRSRAARYSEPAGVRYDHRSLVLRRLRSQPSTWQQGVPPSLGVDVEPIARSGRSVLRRLLRHE